MNLVQFALRRPLTIVVAVIATALASAMAWQRMPKDIFPTLGIPTIYVAQPYGGMDPAQMEGYLTYYYEYHFLYITGIEHVESNPSRVPRSSNSNSTLEPTCLRPCRKQSPT